MKLLGDIIADITSAFGAKPCAPCKKRQAAINAADKRARDALSGKARRGRTK